jgi:dCMP deaminase
MKQKLIQAYMKTAETFAELSHARRLHVGAIVVKDDRIISIGYNGMPAGWDNNCEDTVFVLHEEVMGTDMYSLGYTQTDNGNWVKLKSKPEVLHAETNAIAKLAKSTESGDGAVLFVTHSPCLDCAKLIFQSGIRSVFYRNSYRNTDGTTFLERSGVTVEQIEKGS